MNQKLRLVPSIKNVAGDRCLKMFSGHSCKSQFEAGQRQACVC